MTLRFGTDGVRGVANRELTPELVTALGRAAARVLGPDQPFVVGRDTRRSGPMLEAALVAGLCAEGADVLLVGRAPHPGRGARRPRRGAPGGGDLGQPQPVRRQRDQALRAGRPQDPRDARARGRAGAARAGGQPARARARGRRRRRVERAPRRALDDYVATLVDALQGRQLTGLHVVVDCGNGAAFRAAPTALRALGATVDVLHASPDGININAGCGSTHPDRAPGGGAGRARRRRPRVRRRRRPRRSRSTSAAQLVDGDQILAIAAIDLHDRKLLRGDAVVATVMSNLGPAPRARALRDRGASRRRSATATCSTRSSSATSRSAASSRAT